MAKGTARAESGVVMAYMTAPNDAAAREVVSRLMERRLIACANMFPVRSIYRWKGKICDEPETAVVMKTVRGLERDILREVSILHPYEVPCVEFFELSGGHAPFLEWVRDETGPAPGRGKPRRKRGAVIAEGKSR